MSYQLEVDLIAPAHDARPADNAVCVLGRRRDRHDRSGRRHHRLPHGTDHRRFHRRETTTRTLDDCVRESAEWAAAARSVRDDVIVLVHGGPIAEPEDAQYVLSNAPGLHGFYGASSMERLPTERALTEAVRAFTSLTIPHVSADPVG